MNQTVGPLVDVLRSQVRHLPAVQRVGTVTGVAGLIIESDGPNVGLGELCLVRSSRDDFSVRAEVVGFREHRVLLMPLGDTAGLHVGCEVAAVNLFAGGGDEARLAALVAVPGQQRLGRLGPKLRNLRHQSAQPAGLVGVGGGVGQAAGVEVLVAALHQRPHQLADEPLAAAVAPHVVAVGEGEGLVQPPVGQRTFRLSYPEN